MAKLSYNPNTKQFQVTEWNPNTKRIELVASCKDFDYLAIRYGFVSDEEFDPLEENGFASENEQSVSYQ